MDFVTVSSERIMAPTSLEVKAKVLTGLVPYYLSDPIPTIPCGVGEAIMSAGHRKWKP